MSVVCRTGAAGTRWIETDAQGCFRLQGLEPGIYVIAARRLGPGGWLMSRARLVRIKGGLNPTADLTLSQRGCLVRLDQGESSRRRVLQRSDAFSLDHAR